MEEKLYYQDPYLRSAEAGIVAVEENNVYFDRTVFYPEAGGQPGDRGVFEGRRIVDTKKTGKGIAHVFDDASGLYVGMHGTMTLDWDHRHAFMEKHSAQHLISSLFFGMFGLGTVAVHLSDEYVSIELDGDAPGPDCLDAIEDAVAEASRKKAAIHSAVFTRMEVEQMHLRRSIKVSGDEVRVVFIDGYDAVPCGGVHLASTSEIGEVSFLYGETIRGHVRTFWLVGGSAVLERRRNRDAVRRLSTLLSEKPADVVDAVERKIGEIEALRSSVRHLQERLAGNEIALLDPSVKVHRTSVPLEFFRTGLVKHGFSDILLIGEGDRKEFLYIGCDEAFKKLKDRLLLRGGGRAGLFQGSYVMDADTLEKEALKVMYGE